MSETTVLFSPQIGDVELPITQNTVGGGTATLDVAAVTNATLTALASAPGSSLTTTQIAALTTSQLGGLTTSNIMALSAIFVAKNTAP